MKKKLLLPLAMLTSSLVMFAQKSIVEESALLPKNLDVTNIQPKTAKKGDMIVKTFKTNCRISSVQPKTISLMDAQAESSVSYMDPFGAFYWGLGPTGSFYENRLLGPAYEKITWINTSTSTGPYTWTYWDQDLKEQIQSSEKHLVTPEYPLVLMNAPTLAVGEETFGSKKSIKFGGNCAVINSDADASVTWFGASNYSYSNEKGFTAGVFGNGLESRDWADFFNDVESGVSTGFAEIYKEPEHPYALASVLVYMIAEKLDPKAKFNLKIFKLDSEGNIGEEIAQGMCTGSDAITTEMRMQAFQFPIQTKKGLFYQDAVITVDCPILVQITGLEDISTPVYPAFLDGYTFTGNENPYSSTGFQVANLTLKDGSVINDFLFPTSNLSLGNPNKPDVYIACTGFMINLDVYYTWLKCDDTNFTAPNEGGSKSFEINSYWLPNLDDELVGWKISGAPEWLTCEISENENAGVVTLTAAPLKDVSGRSANVVLSCPGASLEFKVTQGDGGVGIVNTEINSVKAVCNGENFQLTYAEGINSVSVSNIAGQTLATYELPAGGKYTMSAADLTKGMYILKFSNNQTIKVIK